MSLIPILKDEQPPWYTYLALVILVPTALLLTYRVFFNYKVIAFGNDQIVISYPVKRSSKIFSNDKVVHWRELIVKTGKTSSFKELEILFENNFKITIGLKEYTNYPKVYAYLTKKLPGKKLIG
jgi:hypothetical protein